MVRQRIPSYLYLALMVFLVCLIPFSSIFPSSVRADSPSGPTVIATVKVGGGGYSPWGIAVNTTTNRIYVANDTSNNVSVIDGSTNNLVTAVAVGTNPEGIAVNPTANRIYVANSGSNNISVIDGAANAVIATVNVGVHPMHVAVNSTTNQIYVTNNNSNTLSQIDGNSNNLVAIVNVGANPQGVAVNSAASRIYVANYTDNTVSVINSNTNAVVATLNVGVHPSDIAVNTATNRIYVANYGNGTISVIDGSSNAVVATVNVAVSGRGLAVNSTTNRVYASNDTSNTMSVIDGSSNSLIASINVAISSHGLALNTAANRLYVSNYSNNNVSVVNSSSNSWVATVNVGSQPNSVAVNPATNRVYVAGVSSNTTSVIDGSNNSLTATVNVGGSPQSLCVNTAASRVYVANYAGNTVSVMNGSTNAVIATVNVGDGPDGVAANSTTNRVFVANYGSNTVSVIDSSNSLVATINVGVHPRDIAVNPVTNLIYVANYDSNTVSVIDGGSNSVVATINNPASGTASVAVSAAANRVYIANSNSNTISVADGATNNVVAAVNVGAYPVKVAVNPATNRIYVANLNSGTVSVVDGLTNSVTAAVSVGSWPEGLAVNPNNNRIYVANYRSDTVSVIQDSTPSSISLGSSANPSDLGLPVIFTAIVSVAAGTPTGAVTFSDGASALGSSNLVGGQASYTASGLSVGSHSISASYSGDSNFAPSTGFLTQSVIHITFADSNLEAAVRQAINKPAGNIYQLDLLNLTSLTAENASISDLSGLEYCTNLLTLDLRNNRVSNLAPLSSLLKLQNLYLTDNQINNLSALSNLFSLRNLELNANQISNLSSLSSLTGLASLNLDYNQIGSVSALAGMSLQDLYLSNNQINSLSGLSAMSNLQELDLSYNRVNNISELSNLTKLQYLSLQNNQVIDLAPIAGLTRLQNLHLDTNSINSVSPLVVNSGLGSGDNISLAHNFLSLAGGSQSMADIQTLIGRGANVAFQPQDTQTILTSSANPSIFSDPVTFTATVSPLPDGGTVQFADNGSALGSAVPVNGAGQAVYITSSLSAGSHSMTAVYSGNASFSGSSASLVQGVRAALVVTAQNQSIVYSQAIPALTVTYSGFVNGDTPAVLSGSPSLSTAATSYSPLGTYPITVSQGTLTAQNYLFVFVNGTLTINQASTTSSLIPSANPSNFGQPLTLTCVIAPVPPASNSPLSPPTGTVTFTEGSTTLSSVPLSGSQAVFTNSALSLGNHTITASYTSDANFGPSSANIVENITNSVGLVLHGTDLLGPVMTAAAPALNAAGLGVTINTADMILNDSDSGIADVLSGNSDLAMSSRPLTPTESASLTAYAVARDATVIIVDQGVPTDIVQLTLDQIKGIYEGTFTNWNQVGSASSLPILARARTTASDTRRLLLNSCNISDAAEQAYISAANRVDTDALMQQAVNDSPAGSIGYVEVGFGKDALHQNIREIAIVNPSNSIAYIPGRQAIYAGKYPLAHYLYLVNKNPGDTNQMAFIEWMRQADGNGQNAVVASSKLMLVPNEDVTMDGFVDVSDLVAVGSVVGLSNPGHPHWIRADVTLDGSVDVSDLVSVGSWVGASITPY